MDRIENEIIINGVKYVPVDSFIARNTDGLPFVLVRTYSAGVHCGYLEERNGKEVTLLNAIRLWKWSGASACSQLAMEGVKNHEDCKFEIPTLRVVLTEAIEVHTTTNKAEDSIKSVPSWKS